MAKQSYPTLTLSIEAAAAITAYRFFQADGTLAGADENAIGVARNDAASGDMVAVDADGTMVVELAGTVAVGDTLKSDASGKAIKWATSGAKLGIALEAGSSGQFVEIRFIPNVA